MLLSGIKSLQNPVPTLPTFLLNPTLKSQVSSLNTQSKSRAKKLATQSSPAEIISIFNPMTSLVSLSLFLFLFLFPSPSTSTLRNPLQTPNPKPLPTPEIRQACQATRFPDLCETTLSKTHLPNPPKPIDIILSAIEISSQNLKTAQSMVQSIRDSSHNVNRSAAANNCIEYLGYSENRLSSSALIMPRGMTKDAMAWMSAAELYQYDCWQDLYFVNTTQEVNDTMWFLLSLTELTSNALSMIRSYDLFGADAAHWKQPMTERSGFWGGGNGSGGAVYGFRGGFPSSLKADVTVCKEGDGCYRTVQAAVDAAPENLHGSRRFVIYIKEGVYDEIVRVPIQKKNVVFLGDGMGKTVITGKLYSGLPGIFTYNTATVGVNGDGFMARDLTFENAASGANVHQAVAFRSDSDLSVVERCEFLGHQDTLYARTLRQFYNSCRVAGTVDFIFGNSATLFQDSVILLRPRQVDPEKGESNAVTAQGRTDPAQSTGFVFQNCLINGTEEYMQLYYQNPKVHRNYLGRPWKEYSRTLFIHCNLEVLISPEGWMKWIEDFALSTLYYGEFENSGPGLNISGRVSWSSQIPAEHVSVYSVENFIQGDKWIPSYPSL